jgi:CTP-dependent riboflavin kinase
MLSVKGRIVTGVQDFRKRMTLFPEVFREATGQALYPGTLNVKIDREIKIKEDFRIQGVSLGDPQQELLFEKCLINGTNAYRIRPRHITTGAGGHGDHIREIACPAWIPNAICGSEVEVSFFRDEGD